MKYAKIVTIINMKVNEFTKRCGINASKVRYYDKIGILNGKRDDNNYRYYDGIDALELYNALMLRSFDMPIELVQDYSYHQLDKIDSFVVDETSRLNKQLALIELKISRLEKMRSYFQIIQEGVTKADYLDGLDSVNLYQFGHCRPLSNDEYQLYTVFAQQFPFSYVAIRVSKESVINNSKILEVSVGLGMLVKNMDLLGIDYQFVTERSHTSKTLGIMFECIDPFSMTKSMIQPLLDELDRLNIEIKHDFVGRVYMSYRKNDTLYHAVAIGIDIE